MNERAAYLFRGVGEVMWKKVHSVNHDKLAPELR